MSLLNDIRRFLYIGPSLELCDLQKSKEILLRMDSVVAQLVSQKKGFDIIEQIDAYVKCFNEHFFTKQTRSNMECLTFLLASCSKIHIDERFSHAGYLLLSIWIWQIWQIEFF